MDNGMQPWPTAMPAMPYGTDPYGTVPSAPTAPVQTSRPPSWPVGRVGQQETPSSPSAGPPQAHLQPPAYPPAASGQTAYPQTAYPQTAYPHSNRPYVTQMPGGGHLAPGQSFVQGPPMPPPEMKLCEGALKLAGVGSDVILAGEIITGVRETVERANLDQPRALRMSPEELEKETTRIADEVRKGISELAAGDNTSRMTEEQRMERFQRLAMIQQLLQQQIDVKLLYQDAKRKIPAEGFPQIEKSLTKQFDEVAVEGLMKREQVASRRELEGKLRAKGSSLEQEKRAFMQRVLAQQWLHEQVKPDEEITHDQMLEYYREHAADFDHSARVRWKEMMARFSDYNSKAETGAAIAGMGNLVSSGVPFEQVAKANSGGVTASEGGVRDWTTKGSLASGVLDQQLFSPELPAGSLSPILETETGFHIILVTEREEAYRTPFLEAQVEIQPKIRQQRFGRGLREYVIRLREEIPVRTIFDDMAERETLAKRPETPRR